MLASGPWAGGFCGHLRGRFRGHLSCPFLWVRGRRTRARCGEAGDRSICRRTAGAGRLSFSRLSRTSLRGFWRVAPISQLQSNTGTERRETGRKYSKSIGGSGVRLENPILRNQRVGHPADVCG
jgi:hypothetical protein